MLGFGDVFRAWSYFEWTNFGVEALGFGNLGFAKVSGETWSVKGSHPDDRQSAKLNIASSLQLQGRMPGRAPKLLPS